MQHITPARPDHPQTLTAVREHAPTYYPLAPAWWDMNPGEPSVPLAHYLFILRRHLFKMLAFVIACTLATLIVSYRLTPIYESTATVDIDRSSPSGIVGQEALQPFLNDADQFLATQVDLIESDSVLRPVALKYRLFEREESLLDSVFGKPVFDPTTPVRLRNLEIKRPPNTYLLKISYRSPDRQLAADAANAIARSYLEHTYKIRYQAAVGLSTFMERQLEELRAKMERSGNALASFERELNIINPEEKTTLLSARLLELNTEFTKAQSDRVEKEASFRALSSGALQAAHTSSQREALVKLTEDYNQASQKLAEVKLHYGPNHPEFQLAAARVEEVKQLLDATSRNIVQRGEIEFHTALDREQMLAREFTKSKAEFDSLNARSFEYQNLKREAEGDKRLYEELLRRIKESTINASIHNNGARIADPALPGPKPVFPRKGINTLVAFILSAFLAAGAAIAADHLDNTVRDPEQVSRTMNTQVVGTLPMVKSWKGRLAAAAAADPKSNGDHRAALALNGSSDSSVSSYGEAIRTLRNSILLADFDRRVRSLLITSASPGEGKSTTAFYLAIAHSQQNSRTLLIDGDLRRPSVHRRFNLPGNIGLSCALAGELHWKQALVKPEGLPNLDVLPAGPPSHRAADVIGRGLVQLIDEAAREYDLVILDAPPLLGFAEPLQMATAVDGVVVVTRAGQTNRKAVNSVIITLRRLRANVVGLALNEVHKQISDSYYYYGYYRKYYHGNSREPSRPEGT
ncbi:MAG: polysaccharide biosynthesis tyrosine autokinase [Bryobacteraceae bacterium]|nr:polysaccharide biosynthesis tyrosine autokinase [Bryobacteraceae bacterium]